MKYRVAIGVFISLLLLSCIDAPGSMRAPNDDLNLLLVVQGDVQLQRTGWASFHPTAFGAELQRGDLLRLDTSAKALVLCGGLTIWPVPAGVPAAGIVNGCPLLSDPPLVRGTSRIGSTRGKLDPLLPYIISPRKTHLLSNRPTLRWNAVPGVTSYTVQVRGGGLRWETKVNDTEVIYSGVLPLKSGVVYLLVVTADNGKSSQDEGSAGLGFELLNEDEAQRVQSATERLTQLQLPDEAETFALAQLYAGRGLIAEAIEMLETLAGAGSQAAAVYRTLGELYQQIGLVRLAEARYLTAVKLAETAGDIEGQAKIQAGLGEVYTAIGNQNEAIRWLSEAQASYQALGDRQRASELAQRLAEFQKP